MDTLNKNHNPIVSFCISTYKRPELLHDQLALLLKQTYTNFKVVISDNDPMNSAKKIAQSFADNRIEYYSNNDNLGMIKSFNKSIDRSNTEYIVLITDDDPLAIDFLETMVPILKTYPTYSIYAAVTRCNQSSDAVECIAKEDFAYQLIHPDLTSKSLWSNSIIKKEAASIIGNIPDYGSPHLADHAFLALCGSVDGGIMVNKNFGDHMSHPQAFSMGNINSYYYGCMGFYETLSNYFIDSPGKHKVLAAAKLHVYKWFIIRSFFLRRTFHKRDKSKLIELNTTDGQILELYFMSGIILKYRFKRMMFVIKSILHLV